jgi:hypothetical protein
MFLAIILSIFSNPFLFLFLIFVILLDSFFKVNDFCYVYLGFSVFDTYSLKYNIDYLCDCLMSTTAYYMQIQSNFTRIRLSELKYFFSNTLNEYPFFHFFGLLQDNFSRRLLKHCIVINLAKYYSYGRDIFLFDSLRILYLNISRLTKPGENFDKEFIAMFKKDSVKSILEKMDIIEGTSLSGEDYKEIYMVATDMVCFLKNNPGVLKEFQLFARDNSFDGDIPFFTDFQV